MNIIITGASSGLGSELARLYAMTGNHLGLLGRDSTRLDEISTHCKMLGAGVTTGQLDVTDKAGLKAWIKEFDQYHPIDVLIANAGIFSTAAASVPEAEESITEILQVNFLGTLDTAHYAIDAMRSRQSGQIVIISSLSAYRGVPYFPAYSASKSALNTYFDAIRGLLRKDGIVTTLVCPGFIDTAMINSLPVPRIFTMSPEKAAKRIKKAVDKQQYVLDFPLHHRLGIRILDLMPARFADWVMLKFFRL